MWLAWYRVRSYFMINPLHYYRNGGYSWWVRTPLFVIGHYVNAPIYPRLGTWSGWCINWLPTKWTLQYENGADLYKRSWNNLENVHTT